MSMSGGGSGKEELLEKIKELTARAEKAERDRDAARKKLACVYCYSHTEHEVRIEGLQLKLAAAERANQNFSQLLAITEARVKELEAELADSRRESNG